MLKLFSLLQAFKKGVQMAIPGLEEYGVRDKKIKTNDQMSMPGFETIHEHARMDPHSGKTSMIHEHIARLPHHIQTGMLHVHDLIKRGKEGEASKELKRMRQVHGKTKGFQAAHDHLYGMMTENKNYGLFD